ncbi:putative membrane protein [Synechococcus sp. PCC 7502]|uniref:GlsB/YeaQ/YmgE family stress response membrane protein n=1 Tax=Synechococcus sp. PCC 7502 TaxID=1173263 RepID=UPI00029FC464|nr:GlsB/YeaQ/YmgE family stress response membrane protein [Synechococcus sp. PCC 7502]AFY74080.1 putative membrane protein [Synechococcus sp. PCC 7502]
MNILWFILIGMAAGWLAGQLVKGSGFGLVGDIVVGIIGALLGGLIFSTFGVSAGGGLLGSLIVATIGAVILLFGLRLIRSA